MGIYGVLKMFNQSTREYISCRSEESSANLLKSLQTLNTSSEFNSLDPGSRELLDFFVNLYEVMLSTDVKSNITWSAIDVLQNACRYPSTRDCLIRTFKFVPVLTKLLEAKPSGDQKIIILQLMQELTYGIIIPWQEAHLAFLISSLTKWIAGDEPEVVPLALGVLVNLCYKNLPSVYTLMRSVDIKQFLKLLLKVQKNSAPSQVQVCKLLIILEGVSGGVPDTEIETYIRSTCPSLAQAARLSNSSLMRHVIHFFKEIIATDKAKKIIATYKNYAEDIEGLIHIVSSEGNISRECISALFEYFSCVIDLDVFGLESLYPHAVGLALQWIGTEPAQRREAIALISKIIGDLYLKNLINSPPEREDIMNSVGDLLEPKLPVILMLLEINENSIGLGRNEMYAQSTAVILLLSQLVQTQKFSASVINSIDQQAFKGLFDALLSPNCKENDLFQEPVYSFYVEALCFLLDLSDKATSWLILFSELVQEKQVQMVLAIALYTGPEYIKKKALSLTGTTGFSMKCISLLACRMAELNKFVIFNPFNGNVQENLQSSTSMMSPMDLMPILSVTQQGHLNSVLEKCEKAALNNENTITSSVMELYHYKISLMNQNHRQLQLSLEAADQRTTRLQQSLALTNSEVSRLHQLLHGTQQSLEIATKEANSLTNRLKAVQKEAQDTHNKYSQCLQNLRSKTVIITELNKEIEELTNSLNIKVTEINTIQEEMKIKTMEFNSELEKANETISGMKKNIFSLTTQLDSSSKEVQMKNKNIESLKKDVVELSNSVHELEKASHDKDNQIAELNKELIDLKRMREIISELTTGKKKL